MRHSLKWRLVGLFLLLAVATTITFVAGTRELLHAGWQGYGKPLTGHYLDLLSQQVGTPPDIERARALTRQLPIAIRIDGPQVQWDSHPELTRRWQSRRRVDWTDGEIQRWHQRDLPDGHRVTFLLADAVGLRAASYLGWGTLATLLLLTLLAYATVRRLLRPLDDISEGALRYGRGDFAHRIPLRRDDELGQLAQRVNTMAGEIQHMLDAKRALLLAISHELRSPLTRARLNAELVDESAARDALLHDLAEMRDLIIDLLESERLATGHAALQREPTDLNALVVELLAAQFAERGIQTRLVANLPTLPLDRMRLRLLLRNLLDNALRHSQGAAAPPVVSSSLEDGQVVLTVRDHGPGVAPEQLAQLGQAFYRADAARQRSTGGVGLGLTLCRLVAQAHGGELAIANAAPGLSVSVRLPLPAR
ncbi:two-component system, OmpR family, osmolarity sensor histidine kinase EnvZ [Burkholderiaceae bacterium]|nr:two-component system, OmpR family, osmolarity sensor histidine kinase EnvZ [Burkholderiaceae bacterium]